MTAPLRTSWEIQNASGAPTAVVRVKNLQSTIQGPQDAWGRPNRPQPISVSASVSLAKPFGSSSSTDVVDSDTVHYGLLSKAILRTLDRLAAQARTDQITPLPDVLENVWIDLTGLNTFGKPSGGATEKPFLNTAFVRSLSITVYLPKASLLGAGASLTGSAVFDIDDGGVSMSMRGMSLKVHDLRVPTLIGVNDNERTAKQVVVANVEVDKFDGVGDAYCGLEAVVVEAMSYSSYETLEALATYLTAKVARHLSADHDPLSDGAGWHIKVGLEKPVAIPLADAACVELSTDTNDIQETTS